MRFTALVQASVFMMWTAELLWHSMTSSAASGSCFSREDEEDDAAITSEQCCHTLLFCISRCSISLDAGLASLSLWMRSIEADVKTRLHLLPLTEERCCMKYNLLDPEDAGTRFKNITITLPCLCTVAKCLLLIWDVMFYMWKGDVMLKCLSQHLTGSSLDLLNTL